jgi:hypothetical protein
MAVDPKAAKTFDEAGNFASLIRVTASFAYLHFSKAWSCHNWPGILGRPHGQALYAKLDFPPRRYSLPC